MPQCQLCGVVFKNLVRIEGKSHNLQNRKFCLDCSPFKQHNTRDLTNPSPAVSRTLEDLPKQKHCCLCKTMLPVSEFYLNRRTLWPNKFCKRYANRQTVERQQKLKQAVIEHLGSCCSICGYNRYAGALDVHHTDPAAKEFTVGHARSTTFEKIKPELDKCVLLCANCHREEHARQKGLL